MHANPFDSVNIFKDTKCERAMGIHWGTVRHNSERLFPNWISFLSCKTCLKCKTFFPASAYSQNMFHDSILCFYQRITDSEIYQWVLTEEDVLEPPQLLRKALTRSGIPDTGVFDVCEIGESRHF